MGFGGAKRWGTLYSHHLGNANNQGREAVFMGKGVSHYAILIY